LSSVTFQKWYMAEEVKRIPVREGRIRGTLFLPPGHGPFPGSHVSDCGGTNTMISMHVCKPHTSHAYDSVMKQLS